MFMLCRHYTHGYHSLPSLLLRLCGALSLVEHWINQREGSLKAIKLRHLCVAMPERRGFDESRGR